MILTELLQAERDTIKQGTTALPDAELVRQTNLILESLVRKQVEVNQGYLNCEFNIAKAEFHQTGANEFDIQLPSWLLRVVAITSRTPGGDPAVLSPWESPNAEQRGDRMRRSVQGDWHSGWQQIGDLLRLRNVAAADDLVIRAAKRPAKMFKAAIEFKQDEADGLLLPATFTLGTAEIERGAYIGTKLMCTSSSTDSLGAFMVCTASTPHTNAPGTGLRTRLRLARANPEDLVAGDVIESMMPIDSVNANLVVLRVALKVFQRDGNRKGIAAIGDDLSHEMQEFAEFNKPRQNQGPSFAKRAVTILHNRFDPDRDQNTARGWYRR